MKERPIIRSPYAYDVDNIRFMSEAERKRLYERKEYIEKEPYTVIDVLKKVYHRDFIDDFKNSVFRDMRLLELYKKSSESCKISQFRIDSFKILRPESVFGQPIYDTIVDIYAEVGLRVLEINTELYDEKNIYPVKTRLRLRYSFDLRPCHLTCHYLGIVIGEESGVCSLFEDHIRTDKYLLPVLTNAEDYERMAKKIIEEDMPEHLDSKE